MSRALVLSGGGSVGIAWQTGLAAGLAAQGVQLGGADWIIGTSAGSAVGAQLALGRDMTQALERYTNPAPSASRTAASATPTGERMAALMKIMGESLGGRGTPEEGRAAIGRFALETETMPEDDFVAYYRHLEGASWPSTYRCTAVDAETGEFVVWDADSGAELDRAVASSCAVPGIFPPITIKGRRYVDGGMRSATNADLATGHERVLIITLMSPARRQAAPADPRLARYLANMEAELTTLTNSGATVEVVGPDDEAAAVMGLNLMDGARAFDAAGAGQQQAKMVADRLLDFWG